MKSMGSRIIAIIGRPNVGKSTLFNALVGRRVAIVDDQPGVTRDRVYHHLHIAGGPALLVDTGGLLMDPRDRIELGVRDQALLACEEADVVLFVVDGRVPPTSDDDAIAKLLRERSAPAILVANKIDSEDAETEGLAYASMGLGDVVLVSALGRRGLGTLREKIDQSLPAPQPSGDTAGVIAVAIIGKPNVGKSSLLNKLVQAPRAVVDDRPGTTRDATDTVITLGGHGLRIIDTAGIRRRSRHDDGIGYYAYLRALGALDRCDVALLLLDATVQDLEIVEVKLAQQVLLAGKAIAVVVNKWDLIHHGTSESARWRQLVAHRLGFAQRAPVRYVSAHTGRGVRALPTTIADLAARRSQRVSPERLASFVRHVRASNPPPSNRGRLNRLHRIMQDGGAFPRFTITFDDPDALPDSYVRYLRNTLGQQLSLDGIGCDITLKAERRRAR
ncbi:ribosome biogenesis GTPase Der [Candidatus Fermentibacteria bacterium]|nr:ribosome biogenesis GTPase Der [Candidatus Fermentibacteria bacterium]